MKKIEVTSSAGKTFFALIDSCDFKILSNFKWTIRLDKKNGTMYAQSSFGGKAFFTMHELIMGKTRALIDHKNRNGLDNQRRNLRFCTPSENQYNQERKKLGKVPYKGVTVHKRCSRYKTDVYFQARISVNKERIYLGIFETANDAAVAYNKAAKKYHGRFANFNVIK